MGEERAGRRTKPAAAEDTHANDHDPATCPVVWCPVSLLMTATGAARPDVVQHLLAAGNELMLAVKALIEARLDPRAERDGPLERITIE